MKNNMPKLTTQEIIKGLSKVKGLTPPQYYPQEWIEILDSAISLIEDKVVEYCSEPNCPECNRVAYQRGFKDGKEAKEQSPKTFYKAVILNHNKNDVREEFENQNREAKEEKECKCTHYPGFSQFNPECPIHKQISPDFPHYQAGNNTTVHDFPKIEELKGNFIADMTGGSIEPPSIVQVWGKSNEHTKALNHLLERK